MPAKNFPRRLASLRSEQGLTKSGFARAVGVSPTAVINWEIGKSYPRPRVLAKIARVLSTSSEFLEKGGVASDPSTPKPAKTVKVVPSKTADVAEIVQRARQEIAGAAGVDVKQVKIVLEYAA